MEETLTVIGQGYVGLPLAEAASLAGWKVYGLDVTPSLVDSLNRGQSHIDDLEDSDIARMLDAGYVATTDASCITESAVVVICVPTPLGDGGAPDLGAVTASAEAIGANLSRNTLVVLESTTYPGTTEEVVLPLIEAHSGLVGGRDFEIAFSPERINPGDPDFGIRNTPKLVGGSTQAACEAGVAFYSSFIDEVVPLSGTREAETAKLLENTFRHVNIALVNEMAKFCHELGIDIWEVIRGASTKPFGFMRFTPGPGVGGHCIPIDPNYLSYEVRRALGYPFRFVELAQEINNSMPAYIVNRIADILNESGKALNGSNVLLLGVTYKADIADQRESPAVAIGNLLIAKKANLRYFDPHVPSWRLSTGAIDRVGDLDAALREADVVVLLQAHSSFDLSGMNAKSTRFFDTRGAVSDARDRL
ncbi:nucleotide sugar dehydrogenase [Tessaracoccus sp. OS52]|uniref:nucleotide sugar dehydrogenase n=1 Tax=Tessaracoccus sp. OS52 TaxID=2886691 RepID=UPI001D11176F|nr:nucleotide sugar dehydrogenase [Tessaracoccus sp. OS52]